MASRSYRVYVEVDGSGRCLAHVLDLPGCVSRGASREAALEGLPAAIDETRAWLGTAGEAEHGGDALAVGLPAILEVVEEATAVGPFDPGDAAALFSPDRQPLTPDELERWLRLLARSRAELLALAEGLPDPMLDWKPGPEAWSLRPLLRHVGNADEWYVSRLVEPETLPPEWEHDEDLPTLEFLEMERRTAAARLRQLGDDERARVVYPAAWTAHPEEPWTARKALRRALEHEREHTGQARGILAARRKWLTARLAAERSALLAALLNLDEPALIAEQVTGSWTVKDVLAHTAGWDRWVGGAMRSLAAGGEPDWSAVRDVDAANAAFVARWRERSLGEVLAELSAARAEWLDWMGSLPDEEVFRRRPHEGDDWSFDSGMLPLQWAHDAGHAAEILAWRRAARAQEGTGAKAVLTAALNTAREELLAAVALVPAEERAIRPVCGEWTAVDLLGHEADWEAFCVEWLRRVASGTARRVGLEGDIEIWNQERVAARRGQTWKRVWSDLHAVRRELVDVLVSLTQGDLARAFPTPWDAEGTVYRWVCVFLGHDREHARDLRGG